MESIIQPIRSFVRRERRLVQQNFPQALWSQYGIHIEDSSTLISYLNYFNYLTLEIGFGTGDTLFEQARQNTQKGYVGIEVYKTGIKKLLSKLATTSLNNIRLIEGDAAHLLSNNVLYGRFNTIQILFPDPWPKRRHHKRRLIQPSFIELLYQALKPEGFLYLATDCKDYAHYMIKILEASSFININKSHTFSERPFTIPFTKFESRGKHLGHDIWYLVFKKCM